MSYIVDTHCDTLALLSKNNIMCGSTDMELSLPRLLQGNVRLQCFAVCVKSFSEGSRLINEFDRLIKSGLFAPIRTANDIAALEAGSNIGAMLTVEGGGILDCDESKLDILYEHGMRMFSLTWNDSCFLCGGIGENKEGLTDAGRRVLKYCEKNGVIVDTSHISEKGFFELAESTSAPFIASHSNAAKICPNKRNLSDEQLDVIKERAGCIGINFYPPFLNCTGTASVDDIIRHIEYIASKIGIEYIGIGSDFDGVENKLPKGMEHPGRLQTICEGLRKLNYSQKHIDMICHENMLRIFKNILPVNSD